MKKLLSIFAATGLVATSSATVVACTDNVATLTFVEGKTVADFITAAGIEVTDHKLDVDYPDIDVSNLDDGTTIEGTIEGSFVASNEDDSNADVFALFTETKDLQPKEVDNGWVFNQIALKGSKGDAKATIFVYKLHVSLSDEDHAHYIVTKINLQQKGILNKIILYM